MNSFRKQILYTALCLGAATVGNAEMVVREISLKNRTAPEFLEELRTSGRPLPEGFSVVHNPNSITALKIYGEERLFPRVMERIEAWDRPLTRYTVTFEIKRKGAQPMSTTLPGVQGNMVTAELGKFDDQNLSFHVTPKLNAQNVFLATAEIKFGQITATLPAPLNQDSHITFQQRRSGQFPALIMLIKNPTTDKTRQVQVPTEVWGSFLELEIRISFAPVPT